MRDDLRNRVSEFLTTWQDNSGMAERNSSKVKNCSFLRAATIQVETCPTLPSTLGLSFGFRTLAGMIAVLLIVIGAATGFFVGFVFGREGRHGKQ